MPARRSNCLLAKVNFPLYTLQMLTSRHILVGGGGGSSKTGVANGFEIFELSHNGSQFIVEEVTRHETGPNVVMNCSASTDGKRTWIAAGQESHCQLYNVNTKVVSVENGEIIKSTSTNSRDSARHRRASEKSDDVRRDRVEEAKDSNSNVRSKKLQLIVKPVDSVQTDFGEGEPLQRIVRISPDAKIMATGGTDGIVRLWKFPRLNELQDIKAHTKEIDDIDFSPDSSLLATIAKDGKAYLWNVSDGSKNKELVWQPPNASKYMFKRCRFRKSGEDKKLDSRLFVLSNAERKQPSFLQMWNTETGSIVKSVAYKETLSALAVSDDGKFVAVGTMFSGTVYILVAFSLRKALHVPGAHSMFVTGLEFLPTKLDGPAITSNTEAAVVSVSADNKICIHSIPFRHALPFWFVSILIIFSICGAFIVCSYLGI